MYMLHPALLDVLNFLPISLLNIWQRKVKKCFLLQEKPWEAYFVSCSSNILLDLLFIFSETKLSINCWLDDILSTLNHSFIWGTIKICHWISFNFWMRNHPVFNALVHSVAQCLRYHKLYARPITNVFIIN